MVVHVEQVTLKECYPNMYERKLYTTGSQGSKGTKKTARINPA